MDVKERKEHYLALKVMRLTRPTLTSPLLVTSDPKDLAVNIFNNDLKNDVTVVEGVETLAAGQFLQLPQSFGNIYLGETFSSYICVHNDSDVTVRDVTLKTEMQTTVGCTSVTGPPGIVRGDGQIGPSERHAAELLPNESLDQLIQHEVKEDGNHILTCQVSYIGPDNKRTSFPKYFRFPVSKPLDVKTKFYNAESDEVYVEAQVQNKTSGPICLEKVALESSHLFSVTALNTTAKGESVFGRINILPQEASSQFLYCLAPSSAVAADVRLLSGATNVGKLDMVWRSNLGERGRLQTSQLKRMAPECRDVRLSVQEVPNMVALEDPFVFSFRIINTCERALDLVLGLESAPNSGLAWSGVSGRALGRLESGSSLLINLTLIPLIAGLQIVSGVRLTDLLQKWTYDFDDLAQVFVMQGGVARFCELSLPTQISSKWLQCKNAPRYKYAPSSTFVDVD